LKIALSIGVQPMIRADLASSGVMFSIDTETGFRNAVLINAAYGLGENVVQGTVNPDEFYVFKPTLLQGHRQKRLDVLESYQLEERGSVLITGRGVGEKIGAGPVRVIPSPQHLADFQAGEVLVTDKTDPDWEPVMKKAAAIVTNRGGRTCHAAIVSRELGLPAIVGTERATDVLKNGQQVTISCAEGDTGFVYEGRLKFRQERTELSALARPKTKIMVNVGNPDEAFRLSMLPNDGVGLARMEFIVSSAIQVHPMALVKFDQLSDAGVRAQIERLTRSYTDKLQYFVDLLAEGVAMIAAAFS
jgi:pyruvate,water dikinase